MPFSIGRQHAHPLYSDRQQNISANDDRITSKDEPGQSSAGLRPKSSAAPNSGLRSSSPTVSICFTESQNLLEISFGFCEKPDKQPLTGRLRVMPIHLPPISRRRFLGGALAAAGGLALGPDLLAADRGPEARSWALLSDPHLAADRALMSADQHDQSILRRRRRNCSSSRRLPEGVLVTGDCAYILENWPIIPC